MHAVRNGQLLTFCCPGTSSPAVCRIRFSIASLRCRLLLFCYVTDDMESRSQWQCSAKHDGTTRAHPDNRKMKEKNFPRFARRDHRYAPPYTAFGSGRTTLKYLAPALLARYQSVATIIVCVTNALITGSGRGNPKTFGCMRFLCP